MSYNQNLLFSIIVPVYNASDTIVRCIESILSQSFCNFELLIVDDGSADSSLSICEKYTLDTRVKVFHKENGGASSARNYGLTKASGTFVVFADADDYVYPDWLSSFLVEPDADIVIQNIEISKGKESARYLYNNIDNGSWKTVIDFCLLGPWGHPVNKRFRMDLIKKHSIKFDETISLYEDEIFFAKYSAYINSLYQVGYAGYHYEEPLSFCEKYNYKNNIDNLIYQYFQVRKFNPEISGTIIDRLVLESFSNYKNSSLSDANHIIDMMILVKLDFVKLKRRKLMFVKLLRFTKNRFVWQTVYNFYIKHSYLYS